MGGIFTTELDAEHKIFGYHKTVCGARNPAYCKCAVSSSGSCRQCTRNLFHVSLCFFSIVSVVSIRFGLLSMSKFVLSLIEKSLMSSTSKTVLKKTYFFW